MGCILGHHDAWSAGVRSTCVSGVTDYTEPNYNTCVILSVTAGKDHISTIKAIPSFLVIIGKEYNSMPWGSLELNLLYHELLTECGNHHFSMKTKSKITLTLVALQQQQDKGMTSSAK